MCHRSMSLAAIRHLLTCRSQRARSAPDPARPDLVRIACASHIAALYLLFAVVFWATRQRKPLVCMSGSSTWVSIRSLKTRTSPRRTAARQISSCEGQIEFRAHSTYAHSTHTLKFNVWKDSSGMGGANSPSILLVMVWQSCPTPNFSLVA